MTTVLDNGGTKAADVAHNELEAEVWSVEERGRRGKGEDVIGWEGRSGQPGIKGLR